MRDEIDKHPEKPKKISSFAILKHFHGKPFNVIVYDTIDSTNTQARRLLEAGKEPPFLLLAEAQSSGRGRHGNSFFSPESGLYYTFVKEVKEAEKERATIAAAVSLQEAIQEVCGICCDIKWVNDLYYKGKKVAGILCEAPHRREGEPPVIIVGIGVNIAQKEFPEELKAKAGSLGCEDLDRNQLAAALTEHLLAWLEHPQDPRLLEQYKAHSFLLGKQVAFERNGILHTGIARDISREGNLIVEGEKTHVLSSGEVSLVSWENEKSNLR